MEEIKRLEKLLKNVKSCRNKEEHFDYLHTMILAENEISKGVSAVYINNVRQTIQKQVQDYENALLKSNTAIKEYNDIITNFETDIDMGLGLLRLNNPSDTTAVE